MRLLSSTTPYRWDCFGDGSDGGCIIYNDSFLCADREYNFTNLVVCDGATLRFWGQWVPRIKVRWCLFNFGTIDTRGMTYVWECNMVDSNTGCTIENKYCCSQYVNSLSNWCWKWWGSSAQNWCNWVTNCWWAWWNGIWCGCSAWWSAVGYNWWEWWCGVWYWSQYWYWWGWWGWYVSGNWGKWGEAKYTASNDYNGYARAWNWGNWWCWWDGWEACANWNSAAAIWNWWVWGNWYVCGGRWWDSRTSWSYGIACWGNWWDAITNVYWLYIEARIVVNNIIDSSGWKWWDWWCGNGNTWCWGNWWRWWCGGQVVMVYNKLREWGCVKVNWWCGWCGWYGRDRTWNNWANWINGYVVCKQIDL